MLNQLIPSTINLNYPIKPIGRPKLSDEERARRELQKLQKPKNPVGRPKIYLILISLYRMIFLDKPIPRDQILYNKKNEISDKYKHSAYRSGLIVNK
jgi:hypothetical protein